MRLWSIHPAYLDAKGLVALWREGLLAQKVLMGQTQAYKYHPQLERFKRVSDSVGMIRAYLKFVVDEADNRNYNFDRSKITGSANLERMPLQDGQLHYEFEHLLNKLKLRDKDRYDRIKDIKQPQAHPLFDIVMGDVEDWEKICNS